MSLYNEMRPTLFKEVKGQDKVVKIIRDNLSSGHLPNAMLFVGTRGTGKTTVAKIVSKSINCEHPTEDGECCNKCMSCVSIMQGNSLDVIELDAASNNGVDNIREIIETVQFKPVGKKKIIILDEVHMLSTGAFNALLKVMEEPPKDVLFILCTTELHKVPATILSRCRKFQFETISPEMIIKKLEEVNSIYQLKAEDAALKLVAKAAKGSMRDAESIYENFIDAENGIVTETLVRETLGYSNDELVFDILNSVTTGEPTGALEAIAKVVETGGDLVYLLEECFRILLEIICIQNCGDISTLSGSKDYLEKISEYAFNVPMPRLIEIADTFRITYEKKGGNMELALQGMIISLICNRSSLVQLENKVATLEQEIQMLRAGGVGASVPVASVSNLAENNAVANTTTAPVYLDDDEDGVCFDDVEWEPTTVQVFAEKKPVAEEPKQETVASAETATVNEKPVKEETSDIPSGFSQFTDEQIAELSAFGFNMESDEFSADMVNEKPAEETIAEESFMEEDEPMDEDIFGDFARLFSNFGCA